ncbi:MAG: DUF5110 domain-containing protein, partial [Terracidiphilus sp.]
QAIEKIRVYPGADARFTLYSDDGATYAYEKGVYEITNLEWSDASRKLTHTGAAAWSESDTQIVEVIDGSH